ncbi:hypothetical protein P7C70_g6684, partial [Phenoliferia sp. Uapishka_3]
MSLLSSASASGAKFWRPKASRAFSSSKAWEKQRLVIIGSGWAATSGANRTYGSKAPEDGVVPPPEREASFPGNRPYTLSYDKLVIACGAYSRTFNIPGVKEYAHFLKDVKDARKIRSRILECFEQAAQPTLTDNERRDLLHFVIVGGESDSQALSGPTGIEFAAELHDLLATDLLRHFPTLTPLARVTVYDVAPKILAAFDSELVEYAVAQFHRQGVKFGMLVWSTGLAPNTLIKTIKDLKHDKLTASLEVNDHMNTFWEDGRINEDVFCIGDASALTSGKLPATAQVANQEAKFVAKVLNASIKNRTTPPPFEFKSQDESSIKSQLVWTYN